MAERTPRERTAELKAGAGGGRRQAGPLGRAFPLLARPALYWSGFAAWFLFLFGYGTFSTGGGGPDIPHADKVLHFVYYAAGAACLGLGFGASRGSLGRREAALVVAVVAAVGAADEFYQSFFPHRTGNDPADFAADVLGAAAGVALASKLARLVHVGSPGSPGSPGRRGDAGTNGGAPTSPAADQG